VGVNLLEPLNLSKQLTSASKLFEYLAAGIPSVCSRVPETERIFERYNVGLLTEVDPAAVAQALGSMADESSRRVFRDQALVARGDLTWELQLPALLSGVGMGDTTTLAASDR
jgi:glycosyltransferase involved in cell wall biosynthesis